MKTSDFAAIDSSAESKRHKAGLTRRQQQVLECVCLGMCDKEICRHLGMAHGTVKVHLHALFRAFDVPTRLALAVHVLRSPNPPAEPEKNVYAMGVRLK
jgi:two-component system, NarL family, nitrate/nitrite response regulator NarL